MADRSSLSVDDFRDNGLKWVESVLKGLKADHVDRVYPAACRAPLKETLADWLFDALGIVQDYNELVTKMKDQMRDQTGALKTQLIESQQKVIDLQGEVIGLQEQ